MHHVTAIGTSIEVTESFVVGALGMRRVKRTNNFDDVGSFHWYWGVGGGPPGTLVTYFERNPERERPVQMGAGQLAHYAVGVPNLALVGSMLSSRALAVSPMGAFGPDSARFHALATEDPNGHPVIVAEARSPAWYEAVHDNVTDGATT
jgi:glyoxalase family protein